MGFKFQSIIFTTRKNTFQIPKILIQTDGALKTKVTSNLSPIFHSEEVHVDVLDLALQQMKLVICTFISKFEFYPVEETMTELKLKPGYGIVCAPESTMMGIKPRTN